MVHPVHTIVPDLKSDTVARALRDDILKHGWGRPEEWVFDGASYFKAEVTASIEAWCALMKVSAPHHSESHGIIERHNETSVLVRLRSGVSTMPQLLRHTADVIVKLSPALRPSSHLLRYGDQATLSPRTRYLICILISGQSLSESGNTENRLFQNRHVT